MLCTNTLGSLLRGNVRVVKHVRKRGKDAKVLENDRKRNHLPKAHNDGTILIKHLRTVY